MVAVLLPFSSSQKLMRMKGSASLIRVSLLWILSEEWFVKLMNCWEWKRERAAYLSLTQMVYATLDLSPFNSRYMVSCKYPPVFVYLHSWCHLEPGWCPVNSCKRSCSPGSCNGQSMCFVWYLDTHWCLGRRKGEEERGDWKGCRTSVNHTSLVIGEAQMFYSGKKCISVNTRSTCMVE